MPNNREGHATVHHWDGASNAENFSLTSYQPSRKNLKISIAKQAFQHVSVMCHPTRSVADLI